MGGYACIHGVAASSHQSNARFRHTWRRRAAHVFAPLQAMATFHTQQTMFCSFCGTMLIIAESDSRVSCHLCKATRPIEGLCECVFSPTHHSTGSERWIDITQSSWAHRQSRAAATSSSSLRGSRSTCLLPSRTPQFALAAQCACVHCAHACTVVQIAEECPQCGRMEMTFKTAQLRSADEGQTIFYFCKCGYGDADRACFRHNLTCLYVNAGTSSQSIPSVGDRKSVV